MSIWKKIRDAQRKYESRRGIALLFVVLTIPILVGFLGLCIETGHLIWVGQGMQIGADAAALAAAQFAKEDMALGRTAAVNVALANRARDSGIVLDRNDEDLADGDIVYGRFDRDLGTFDAAHASVNAVKVVVRRTSAEGGHGAVPTIFAQIFGVTSVDMQRVAIAMVGGGTGAGLMALANTGECTLDISGDVETVVTGEEGTAGTGAIQVNSDDDCAGCFQGSIDVNTDDINLVGDLCVIGGAADYPPETPDSDYVPDPLAFLGDPTTDGCVDMAVTLPLDGVPIDMQGGEIRTIGPGYYPDGITMNNGTLTLTPGMYVLGGAGLQITGSANFYAGVGGGALFYIDSGCVALQGTGEIVIEEGSIDAGSSWNCIESYEFVTLYQARDNTCEGVITGTGLFDLEGSVYFPVANVQISGDSAKLGNQFIAWTVEIFGNGSVTIDYDGRFPAPGRKSYLVF
jgi:hypothetical protein